MGLRWTISSDFDSKYSKFFQYIRFYLFRYNIYYSEAVEVTSRFKGLDLIERVSEELWTEFCAIVWEAVI